MKLALVAAAWLAGMLLGLERDLPLVPLYLLLGASAASGIALYLWGWSVFPAVLGAFLVLGLWRGEASQGTADLLTTRFEQQVSVQGSITDDPEATDRSIGFELSVSAIDRGSGYRPTPGRLLVYAAPPDELAAQRAPPYFRYGDQMGVSGTLRRPAPFEGFDYPAFLAAQGISGVLLARDARLIAEGGDWWRKAAYSLRRDLSDSIDSALPYPQSALGQAMLLGQRGSLADGLVEDFRGTGAAHLLAISGMHVGILMVMAAGIAAWVLGRRWQIYLLVPLAAICVYAVLAGGSPSVVRAVIMGSVYLAALGLGRPHSALPAIGLAAAAMTAHSPELLKQAGFQLSFAAVAGIALAMSYFPPYQLGSSNLGPTGFGWRWRIARPVLGLAVISAAAAVATWPLLAYHFGQAALLGVPVTVLALPAMPFVMAGTLTAAVTGLAHPAAGEFFGWLAWAPSQYLIWLVSVVPAWTFEIGWAGKWLLVGWYGGLVALLLARGAIQGGNIRGWVGAVPRLAAPLRLSPLEAPFAGVAVAGAVAAVVLWLQVFSGADGQLHVHFFDVGQGDSALIVTPSGRQVLVDGGPATESATQAMSEAASPSGRRLDLIALTHLDADHSRGLLEVLQSYRTGAVLVGRDDPDATMRAVWNAALERRDIEPLPIYRGYLIDLGSGVEIEVLSPTGPSARPRLISANDGGLVLRLTYGSVSFLLTADIEAATEGELAGMGAQVKSTVLKVAHHGSKTSSTGPFLAAVNPSVAVVSVGASNPYGHPNPQVMERLESHVGEDGLYRTDQDGSVEFVTDGNALWVKTDR